MKRLSIFLAMLLIFGIAAGQGSWYTPKLPVNTTGDINADNGVFTGNVDIDGVLTVDGGTVSNGVLDANLRLAANHWLYSTTGTGGLNFANATGFFNSSTGANYWNGNVSIAGAKTFTSGTGAFDVNGAMTSKGITQDSGYNINQTGAALIKVGTVGLTATTSPINILENVTFAANKNLLFSGTSALTSGSGITKLKGVTSVYGASYLNSTTLGTTSTFTSGTGIAKFLGATSHYGAAYMNGTTVATGATLAVTDADKLTVGGVIVPQYWDFNVPISASSVDTYVFLPTSNWKVISVKECHSVAGDNGSPVNVTIKKATAYQTPANGTAILSSVIDLKGTAYASRTGSVSATAGVALVNTTDRLAFDFTGTLTNLAGGVVTVRMQRQ